MVQEYRRSYHEYSGTASVRPKMPFTQNCLVRRHGLWSVSGSQEQCVDMVEVKKENENEEKHVVVGTARGVLVKKNQESLQRPKKN